MPPAASPQAVGRYLLFDEIASGGMATVHYGRMLGSLGFGRTVAIKRLHPTFAKDPEFVAMFVDEARVAARISHPNVVSTLDVVTSDGEMLLVMEYIQGAPLSQLARVLRARGETCPPAVAVAILCGTLTGLHAAHEATSEHGEPLGIVHRDVSPQNVLLGVDGVPRVVDFGVASAVGRLQTTRDGQIKGKTAYMAPEQIRGRRVDRRADVYAAAVVLWELLTGQRLFTGDSPIAVMNAVLERRVPPPSELVADAGELDDLVLLGMARDVDQRFDTAHDMAVALEARVRPASARELGQWVRSVAGDVLDQRARRIAEIESSVSPPAGTRPLADDLPLLRTGEPTSIDVDVEEAGPTRILGAAPAASRRRVIVAGALGVMLLGAGIWVASSRPSASAASPPPIAPVPVAAVSASASPVAVVPSLPPVVVSSAEPQRPAPPVPVRAGHAPAAPKKEPARPNCTPPYTLDASGTRHWKDGC